MPVGSTATPRGSRFVELPAGLLDVRTRSRSSVGRARAARGGRPGGRGLDPPALGVLLARAISAEVHRTTTWPAACARSDRGDFVLEHEEADMELVLGAVRRPARRGAGAARSRDAPLALAVLCRQARVRGHGVGAGVGSRAARHDERGGGRGRREHVKVGVPKEVKNHEYRVAITPIGVHELIAHGHEVFDRAERRRRLADPRRGVRRGRGEDPRTRRRGVGHARTWCSRSRSRSPRSTTGCGRG